MARRADKDEKHFVEQDMAEIAEKSSEAFEGSIKSATDRATEYINKKFKGVSKELEGLTAAYESAFESKSKQSQKNASTTSLLENILKQSGKGQKFDVNWKSVGLTIGKEVAESVGHVFSIYFTGPLKSAVSEMSSAYENNFTEIAGRMGTNRDETYNEMKNAVKSLNDSSAKAAVDANKELIPELAKVAKAGWQGQNAIAVALTNSVDKKIMPWLDTASQSWNNILFNLDEGTVKQLKSQQLLLQESQSGNRLLQSGVINSMTNDLSPTLTNIEYNTGGTELPAEAQSIMEQLVKPQEEGGAGLSEQQAYALVKDLIKYQQNPTEAFDEGTFASVMQGTAILNGGGLVEQLQSIMPAYQMEASAGNFAGWIDKALGSKLAAYTGGSRGSDASRMVGGVNISAIRQRADELGHASTSLYEEAQRNAKEKVTAKQSYDNKLKNGMTEATYGWNTVAHGVDVLQEIQSLVEKILLTVGGAIVGNIALKGAGKLLGNAGGKVGGSILKSLASKLGSSAAGEAVGGAAGEAASGGLSSAVGSGLSTAASVAGPVLGAAGIVANSALAINEFSQIEESSNTDKENINHAVSGGIAAAGAAGAGAAGAILLTAGASIPVVGWVAAAIGGIALVAKSAYDARNTIGGAAEGIAAEYEAQKENVAKISRQNKDTLQGISGQLMSLTDSNEDAKALQQVRNDLINSGLLSEYDINQAREANAEGLRKLTESYLKANAKWSADVQNGLDKYEKEDKQNALEMQLNAREVLNDWLDSGKLKEGSEELEVADTFLYTMYNDLKSRSASGETFDDDTQTIYEDLLEAYKDTKLTEAEANSVIDEGLWNSTFNAASLGTDAMSSAYNKIEVLKTDAAKSFIKDTGGSKTVHGSNRAAEALTLASQASNANSEQSAREYLESAKSLGYTSSEFSEIGDAARAVGNKYGWSDEDIKRYAVGSPYISSMRPAILDEGEAVLTASENQNRLQSIIDTAKVFASKLEPTVVDSGSADAVNKQTDTIVAFLKQIITSLSAPKNGPASFDNSMVYMNPSTANSRNIYSL